MRFIICLLFIHPALCPTIFAVQPPDIVFLHAEDLGNADVGWHGSDIIPVLTEGKALPHEDIPLNTITVNDEAIRISDWKLFLNGNDGVTPRVDLETGAMPPAKPKTTPQPSPKTSKNPVSATTSI